MINVDDNAQLLFFDPWEYLIPKRRSILDMSWPGLFRNEILLQLPVQELKACFSKNMGRPIKELYTMLALIEFFKGNSKVCNMYSYKLLEIILREQCNLVDSGDKVKVAIKKPKDISSDSLQNPDSTYSGHKGQGLMRPPKQMPKARRSVR